MGSFRINLPRPQKMHRERPMELIKGFITLTDPREGGTAHHTGPYRRGPGLAGGEPRE